MTEAFIGLGSNQGDRRASLQEAVRRLSLLPGTTHIALSPLYRTTPVDMPGGEEFLNGVMRLNTPLSARDLLDTLMRLEADLGRKRIPGQLLPRPLDLDLLLFGDLLLAAPDPLVPHPRLAHRVFVLQPLADLAPTLTVPGTGRTVVQLLAECRERHPEQAVREAGTFPPSLTQPPQGE